MSSSYIKVNYEQLEKTASKIDAYLKRQKNNMAKATNEVTMLRAFWSGKDYDRFLEQWNRLDDKDSTTYGFTEFLESYADLLRYSAKEYKKAQEKAIQKANSLRGWF